MIQSNEFRIGNLVYYDNRFFEIDTIAKEIPTLNTIEFGIGVVNWNDLKPIPITEEWLTDKFVFNKDYKKGFIGIDVQRESGMTTDFVLTEPFVMGEWQTYYAFVYDTYRFVKLEYIHQLQNLFFAHTQKELVIVNK